MQDINDAINQVHEFLEKHYIYVEKLNVYINKKYIRSLILYSRGSRNIPVSHLEVLKYQNFINNNGLTELGREVLQNCLKVKRSHI